MEWYHTSNDYLENGTIIRPRYGEIIQDERYFKESEHNHMQHIKEMLFEEIRKEHYSNKPSRLNCLYLIDGKDNATEYAKKHNKPYITEVTILTSGTMLTADMNWLDIANQRQSYDGLKEIAHMYFKGEKSDNPSWEILFNGEAHTYNCLKLAQL